MPHEDDVPPSADARRDVAVPADERPHPGGGVEEWVFAAWTPDARVGVISGHRLLAPVGANRRNAWYWAAYAPAGGPLFHVTEFDIPVRSDPFIVKAEALWAEHTCDAPLDQWSIGNETYSAALDDVGEALGRAYGLPTPIGFDLEWYATVTPESLTAPHGAPAGVHGFVQEGVVHGVVELAGRPRHELVEVPARRWRRWSDAGVPLAPLELPPARAHTGVRAPFAFPDGTRLDWVLTADGWRSR